MTLLADNPTQPHQKRWTKQEYHDLTSKGFVDPGLTFIYRGELVEKSAEGELVPKLWTKREFQEKVERGFLSGQRVFLWRGELIEMASMGALHWQGIKKLNYWLTSKFRPEFEVNSQAPFEAFDESMPQPDGAIYTKEQDSRRPCPNAALLLIEISDSSVEVDQEKALAYAASQVQEYWLVNLRDRNTEIYRGPVVDASSMTGFSYSSHQIAPEGEAFAPLFKPEVSVRIAEFLSNS
jgi:Uma2 family endonuclease